MPGRTANGEHRIWRALSDPTRRRLLDLLRQAPRTTGQLCEPFGLSRFAIMKHLGVLEDAGLLIVKRIGRERWNYLNAVPIRNIYDRWVSGFASHWAASLTSVKDWVEQQQRRPLAWPVETSAATKAQRDRRRETSGERVMAAADSKPKAGESFEIEQEVLIEAPRARVFDSITRDIDKWWHHRHEQGKSVVRLEARVGGHFWEDFGDGQGALWGIVSYVKRPDVIRLSGPLGMMSAAVTNNYAFELVDKGHATLLKLSHQATGFIDPNWKAGYSAGWQDLLGKYLKAWAEESKPYTAFEK
jgi:DNA-binding transcriptional ArsR family regulator/uncharacterized protein YndB with AHSA1/START domain